MTHNRLGRETSPYLRHHRDDPVHWQPWDAEALALARRQGKPILLSIGYAACHWCHVMARESFADAETAALMNALFVSIKVDREERPDLDSLYLNAVARLGVQPGWPLTVFLTPDGAPFAGGTYFPPEPRHGRPAFRDVLREMATLHADDPAGAAARGQAALDALRAAPGRQGRAEEIGEALLNHVAGQLLDQVDRVYGGFGTGGPKFPQPALHELLWRACARTGDPAFGDAVVHALKEMCNAGLYDHLGGGFHRYTVDDRWRVPHFEKMLYDNAQMVALLTAVWQGTHAPLFAERVAETVAWALRELRLDGGAFAASLAADSPAGEGAFHVWTEAEVDALLGPEGAKFKRVYDVTPDGNWNGVTVLHRAEHPRGEDSALEARLAAQRRRLLAARDRRPRPERDDKVLADWNGLMVTALVEAGLAFEAPAWIAAARDAFAFVCEHLCVDGRLHHSHCRGRLGPADGFLDDYANMSLAALALYEASGEESYLMLARSWVAVLDARYRDPAGGGYFMTAADADPGVVRLKSVEETAAPSGNGVMVGVLARLHALTGEAGYRVRAEEILAAFADRLTRRGITAATALNNSEALHRLAQVVVAGPPEAPETAALRRVVHRTYLPDRLAIMPPPGATLPEAHPAAGKLPADGGAAAFVCVGATCFPPVREPSALREALRRHAAPSLCAEA